MQLNRHPIPKRSNAPLNRARWPGWVSIPNHSCSINRNKLVLPSGSLTRTSRACPSPAEWLRLAAVQSFAEAELPSMMRIVAVAWTDATEGAWGDETTRARAGTASMSQRKCSQSV